MRIIAIKAPGEPHEMISIRPRQRRANFKIAASARWRRADSRSHGPQGWVRLSRLYSTLEENFRLVRRSNQAYGSPQIRAIGFTAANEHLRDARERIE